MKSQHTNLSLHFGPLRHALDELIPARRSVAVLVSGTVKDKAGSLLGLEELAARCDVTVLPKVTADAPLPEIEQALVALRHVKPDLLVGIGGGSTLDAAKVLSVFGRGGDPQSVFQGTEKLPTDKIPLWAVPTTAGSGAETSQAAIVFDPKTGTKGGLRGAIMQPDKVIVDTALYLHAPAAVLAECGFDALTHAIETAVSKAANPLVRWQSAAAIRVFLNRLPQAVEKKCPLAMEQVALAALQMGTNLANSSTCLPHRIQYALRSRIAASHASGLVMLYRGWLGLWRRQPGITAMDELAAALGYSRVGFIEQVEALKARLGLHQKLSDHGLAAADLPTISAAVTGSLEQDPLYTGRSTLDEILQGSL